MPALFCSKASSYTSKNRIWHLVGGWDAKTQSTVTASCSCQKSRCTEWTSIASPSPDAQDQCNVVPGTHIVHRKTTPLWAWHAHDACDHWHTKEWACSHSTPHSTCCFNPLIPLFQEHYPPRNGQSTQHNSFGLFSHSNLNDDQWSIKAAKLKNTTYHSGHVTPLTNPPYQSSCTVTPPYAWNSQIPFPFRREPYAATLFDMLPLRAMLQLSRLSTWQYSVMPIVCLPCFWAEMVQHQWCLSHF